MVITIYVIDTYMYFWCKLYDTGVIQGLEAYVTLTGTSCILVILLKLNCFSSCID